MNKVNFNTALNVSAPAVSIEATQRDFTVRRIQDTKYILRDALAVQFNIDANARPRTAADLIAAIKSDDFTIDQAAIDKADADGDLKYYGWDYGIRWGKATPDRKGYGAAVKVLDTAMQAAIDEATLAPVDQLQDILKKFQAWTYTPAV